MNLLEAKLQETSQDAAKLSSDYRQTVRQYVYSLWEGSYTVFQFNTAMQTLINSGLYAAWLLGFQEIGIQADEISSEEWFAFYNRLRTEKSYITGYTQFIVTNGRENRMPFSKQENRIHLWGNRWMDIYNLARQFASKNAPLTWVFGGTTEHCPDCAWAAGRTYRANIWAKYGWAVQSPNLKCTGLNCQCRLEYTGNKLNRGHPRRLAKGLL